jgi:hypothetical protein
MSVFALKKELLMYKRKQMKFETIWLNYQITKVIRFKMSK